MPSTSPGWPTWSYRPWRKAPQTKAAPQNRLTTASRPASCHPTATRAHPSLARRAPECLSKSADCPKSALFNTLLGRLLWEAVERCEGVEAIAELERARSFGEAERQVALYLSDPDWAALPDMLIERVQELSPRPDVVFLVRAGAMAPSAYHMSKLLDELQGRTAVPIILCYPGVLETGSVSGLRFMDLPGREATGNYRVKIYG